MIDYWILWGLGWLFLPRMTIGIMLWSVFGHNVLGAVLMIIGFLLDTGGE